MAKISKTVVDKELRDKVFSELFDIPMGDVITTVKMSDYNFQRINDRQWGVILTDANGEQRYIRIGAIVAELREDMTAEELMQSEIDAYELKQAEKAEAKAKKAEKAKKDKERRAKVKAEADNPNQYLPHEVTV